jgi:hypothetical protein
MLIPAVLLYPAFRTPDISAFIASQSVLEYRYMRDGLGGGRRELEAL